jgi:hypothetical protein
MAFSRIWRQDNLTATVRRLNSIRGQQQRKTLEEEAAPLIG